MWPNSFTDIGDFQGSQIWGVRGGFFVSTGFEIGANWSWNNHFQAEHDNVPAAFAGALGFPQAAVRGNLWEMEFTYNFGKRSMFGSSAVRPYLVASGGGITTNMKNADIFVLNNRFIDVPGVAPATLALAAARGTLQTFIPFIDTTDGVAFIGTPTGSTAVVADTVVRDHATFFTFSYGGGLKMQRIWGPLGFFGDVRGRTIPNYFNGRGTNLFELTAGLNFSWGER